MSFALGRKIKNVGHRIFHSHELCDWTKVRMSWVLLTIKSLVFNRVKPYQTLHRTQLDLKDIQHKLQPILSEQLKCQTFLFGILECSLRGRRGRVDC